MYNIATMGSTAASMTTAIAETFCGQQRREFRPADAKEESNMIDVEEDVTEEKAKSWGLEEVDGVTNYKGFYNFFELKSHDFNQLHTILKYHNTLPIAVQNSKGKRVLITKKQGLCVEAVWYVWRKVFAMSEDVGLHTSRPQLNVLTDLLPIHVGGYSWKHLYENSAIVAKMSNQEIKEASETVSADCHFAIENEQDSNLDVRPDVQVEDVKWEYDIAATTAIVSRALYECNMKHEVEIKASVVKAAGVYVFLYSSDQYSLFTRIFVPKGVSLVLSSPITKETKYEGPLLAIVDSDQVLSNISIDIHDGILFHKEQVATPFERELQSVMQKEFMKMKNQNQHGYYLAFPDAMNM